MITNGTAATQERAWILAIRSALEAAGSSIAAIILREQLPPCPLSDSSLHTLYEELYPLTASYGVNLLLHRNFHLPWANNTDGIHLQQDPEKIFAARQVIGPGAMIGYSAHTTAELAIAFSKGADYCFLSPIFKTTSKKIDADPLGVEFLLHACSTQPGPIVALGGISVENAGRCRTAGAAGVASLGFVFNSDTPGTATASLVSSWFSENSGHAF